MPLALVLLRNDVSINFFSLEVTKCEKQAPDTCVFKVPRTQALSIGDDIKVRTQEATPTFLFAGRVAEINESYGVKEARAISYGVRLDETRVFPSRIYTNRSPEFIARDLVLNVAGLSWGSSWSSGVTIAYYEAVGSVIENLRRLARIAGADFWIQISSTGDAAIRFEPANTVNLNVSLVLSGSSANAIREEYNPSGSEIVNAAEVYGKVDTVSELFGWDIVEGGPASYVFVKPSIGKSVSLRGMALAEGTDYRYEPSGFYSLPAIVFPVAPSGTSMNPTELRIEYQVDNTKVAYAENSASVSQYGRRMRAYIIDNEVSETDLQNLANRIVSLYSSPRETLKVVIPGIDKRVRDGGFVTVTDSTIGMTNRQFVVRKVTWKYPESVTELELGAFSPEIYDFQKEFPSLTETAGRSVVQTAQRHMQRRLYFSGSAAPFGFATALKDAVLGSATGIFGTGPDRMWLSLDLILIGAQTRTYTRVGVAPLVGDNVKRQIYGSPITALMQDYSVSPARLNANASNQITLRVQVFAELFFGGTRYLLAPQPLDSTKFFEITVSGVKRILPTTLGWSAIAKADIASGGSGEVTFYWGQSSAYASVEGSNIFNLGFEVV